MSGDKHADNIRLIDLSKYILLKRGSDVIADTIIYHGDCWWKVLGNRTTMESEVLYAEKAGGAEEVTIPIDDSKTYLTILEDAPLQFRDGELLSTVWPDKDLIYVDKAFCKAVTGRGGLYEKDEVHGLFSRRNDSAGYCYYAPVEPEDQGIDRGWMLVERYDLILEWRPVNIAAVLREAI
jgi:hypothetical protein